MTQGKVEMHGCIVCGKLYQLVVAYDANGKFIASRVMGVGGKPVKEATRPLVACEKHTDEVVERAVKRVYGREQEEDED